MMLFFHFCSWLITDECLCILHLPELLLLSHCLYNPIPRFLSACIRCLCVCTSSHNSVLTYLDEDGHFLHWHSRCCCLLLQLSSLVASILNGTTWTLIIESFWQLCVADLRCRPAVVWLSGMSVILTDCWTSNTYTVL